MKRRLLNIVLASLLTLAAYICLYFIWGALLSDVENEAVKQLLLATMTSTIYALCLLYWSKLRRSIGEKDVLDDYKERSYISFIDDFRLAWKRERLTVLSICAIILLCFLLNTLNPLSLGSTLTFLFSPLFFFIHSFKLKAIGYLVSAIYINLLYLLLVLLYRKKRYDHWYEEQ